MKNHTSIPEHIAHPRKVRSFVKRDGRMTEGQRRVLVEHWPKFGLPPDEKINYHEVFQREAKRIFEIGFGSGHSLLEVAKANPDCDFMGVEMYQPGIGTLLLGMEADGVSNIRIFYHDAVEVLQDAIPDASLDVVQIFFPDPWRKRRHHKRRLIQPEFVKLITTKLKPQGLLHLATDWEDYAMHMMEVLSAEPRLQNLAGVRCFAERSEQRPVITKFEQRGTRVGRKIWELQFSLDNADSVY